VDERSGTYRAVCASQQVHGLAEGPVWDAERQRLLWVDISAGRVHTGTLHDDQVKTDDSLSFPGTVGAAVCSARGELLVAGARHLYTVAADGTTSIGPQLIADAKLSRFNDGGCDPAGRFLVGSMSLDGRVNDEQLLRIEDDGEVSVIDDDLSLSNGLAWSPDGVAFYSIDTTPGVVAVRSYDIRTGATGERREFLHIADGSPDGMCVDADGNLWIAIWGGGQVRCFAPTGEQLATIEVPAPNTTSVAFVGPRLDTLLITTAANELSHEQRARYPDSGRLFTCRVDTTGVAVPPWSGVHPQPRPVPSR
jgi:sugar lactone lactonase YvrE